jgi:hypothetical protein
MLMKSYGDQVVSFHRVVLYKLKNKVVRCIDAVSSCYDWKEITFVTAPTNCNFLGYNVKFDEEITCKENL